MDLRNSTVSLAHAGAHYFQQMPDTLLAVGSLAFTLVHALQGLLSERWVQDGLKLMLLGSVMEMVRQFWQTLSAKVVQLCVAEARIEYGDFAWDWLDDYLAASGVWENAMTYRVVTVPPRAFGQQKDDTLAKDRRDAGHPRPTYQNTPDAPEFWRWRGHWVKVVKAKNEYSYTIHAEVGGRITLSVYFWNRRVLKEILNEARQGYISKSCPRLISADSLQAKTPSVVIATFVQPDQAYDWILSFLASLNAWQDVREVTVWAKKSVSAQWGMQTQTQHTESVPAADRPQLLQWQGYWLQTKRESGTVDWRTGREYNAKLSVILHHADRALMDELVEEARVHWRQAAQSSVTIHIADQHGQWSRSVRKMRRGWETVILPQGMKEMLLSDAREFLAKESERWYKDAGVPYRRGYLLYGVPGAGKSSTIHALASELMLPIYSISLATRGLDDSALQSLVAETPVECILSIEDIDCAFPEPRSPGEEDGEDLQGPEGYEKALRMFELRQSTRTSAVTLSGLLNVIDGVWSEEGRLLVATTNHIEKLDPALIRPGRLDVRVHYTAATRDQAARMFARFFPPGNYPASSVRRHTLAGMGPIEEPETIRFDGDTVEGLAAQFADAVPPDMFSAADLQGHLLLWKNDPLGAIEGVREFLDRREREERQREDAREKAKEARQKARKQFIERMKKAELPGRGETMPQADLLGVALV